MTSVQSWFDTKPFFTELKKGSEFVSVERTSFGFVKNLFFLEYSTYNRRIWASITTSNARLLTCLALPRRTVVSRL